MRYVRWAGVLLTGVILVLTPVRIAASTYFLWIYDSQTTNMLHSGQVVQYSRVNDAAQRSFLITNGNTSVLATTFGGSPIYEVTCVTGLCWVGVFVYVANPDPMPTILEQGDTLFRGTGVKVLEYDAINMLAFGHNPNAMISSISGFVSTSPVKDVLVVTIAIALSVRAIRVLIGFLAEINSGSDYRLEGINSASMSEAAMNRGSDGPAMSGGIPSLDGPSTSTNVISNDEGSSTDSEGSYDGRE